MRLALLLGVEIAVAHTAPGYVSRADGKSKQALLANAGFVWLVAILLSIFHGALAITASMEKSPTYDEPAHLTAGYSYWLRNDFRLDPENGNLQARWAALPLLFTRPNFPEFNSPEWKQADGGRLSDQFFYDVGNNSDCLLLQSRTMIALFSASLCLLIFVCANQLFGAIGGLISESIAVFDPNLLAHGALVTSDTMAAFFFLAAGWSCWQLLHRLTARRFAISALSIAGLFLTKMSASLFLLVAGILAIVCVASRESITIQIGRFAQIVVNRWHKSALVIGSLITISAIVVLTIWTAFSFRFSPFTETGRVRELWNARWDLLLADNGPAEKVIGFARTHRLLPEAFLYGLAFVHHNGSNRPAFLDNQWSVVGFHSFFPRAFLYKTPLPLLGLFALGLWTAFTRSQQHQETSPRSRWEIPGRDLLRLTPLWSLALIYGGCSLASRLNIGHRHILPLYPVLFIACGACAQLVYRKHKGIAAAVVAILLLWHIGESFAIRPDYLAYFNQVAGGALHGYKHLVDSSLDWGQDLPALKMWLDAQQPAVNRKPLYLAYFGKGHPRWYGIDAEILPEKHLFPETASVPFKAGFYCLSATILQSVYSPEIGPWCRPYEAAYQTALAHTQLDDETTLNPSSHARWIAKPQATPSIENIKEFERLRLSRLCAYLRHRQPAAEIGHSILVFDLDTAELDRALYGSPPELESEVCVRGY